MAGRYRDRGEHLLGAFADEILVGCPACGCRAAVLPASRPAGLFTDRRMACGGCGAFRSWPPTGTKAGPKTVRLDQHGATDPYLGLPLWLQAPCRGHVLWAWNERHLDALEGWIGADLRERAASTPAPPIDVHETMLESLPTWMTERTARDDVLRVLRLLRVRLASTETGRNRH
jgi:hypothetical protein